MGGHQEGETLPHQEANYRPSGPIPPGPSMDLLLQSLKQESGWGSAKYRTEYTRCKWLTCLHMVQRPSHIKRNNTGLIRKQQASSLWTGLPTSSVPILTHMNATVCVCGDQRTAYRSPFFPFYYVGPRLLVLAESSHTHWAILLALILFLHT